MQFVSRQSDRITDQYQNYTFVLLSSIIFWPTFSKYKTLCEYSIRLLTVKVNYHLSKIQLSLCESNNPCFMFLSYAFLSPVCFRPMLKDQPNNLIQLIPPVDKVTPLISLLIISSTFLGFLLCQIFLVNFSLKSDKRD